MRTLIISDIHIGDPRYITSTIIHSLQHEEFDRLVLNGDIVEGWGVVSDNVKEDRLVHIINEVAKTKEVYWVLGNHDTVTDGIFENVAIVDKFEFVYQTHKFLVVHGNEVYKDKEASAFNRFIWRANNFLYRWFGLDVQTRLRKSSLYKNRAHKMRTKLLNKYDGLYSYIIMGHTHQIDYLCSNNTVLLDIGSPHSTKTYMLILDDNIYLRRTDGCTKN